MKKKQLLIIIPISIVILLIVLGFAVVNKIKKATKVEVKKEEPVKKRITEPVNVIPVSERPYLKIIPTADGKHLNIIVQTEKKSASSYDFELEYQSGTVLQFAMNTLILDQIPNSYELLLGSCSAGGACSYHEDIKGGTMLARFITDQDKYTVKSDWVYVYKAKANNEYSSKDAKLQFTSNDIKASFLVIYNTPGYPMGLSSEPVSEIYSLTASSELSGKANLTLRINEEKEAVIMGYNGTSWQEFPTTRNGKDLTAEVDLMEAYTAVAK